VNKFEDFNVAQEPNGGARSRGESELFGVLQQPQGEILFTVEALGGLCDDEEQLVLLRSARDQLERQLLIAPEAKLFAAAEEGSAGFGNVVGIGIGEKEIRGVLTGQLAVKVFVKEKLDRKHISSQALVPEAVDGVPTDVDATGELYAHRFDARLRPALGGVSIGPCSTPLAGTLGCLVTRANQLFILSNNHVIATGDEDMVGVGIAQPATGADGGHCSPDIIARLTQFVPIAFDASCNFVDAAVARTSPNLVDQRILRPLGVREALQPPLVGPALNSQVQKSGRTTQYRRGLIDAINATVDINYSPFGGSARFCDQFRVRGISGIFSDRGDSGSLVTTFPANNPVGLLFAGNAATGVTFCNDIGRVVTALGVDIVF
jgi:hypothetical protein